MGPFLLIEEYLQTAVGGQFTETQTPITAQVTEPHTLALLGAALVGIGYAAVTGRPSRLMSGYGGNVGTDTVRARARSAQTLVTTIAGSNSANTPSRIAFNGVALSPSARGTQSARKSS